MDCALVSKNAELYEIAGRVLPGAGLGGYALAEEIRFVFAEGQGARLRDVDGREYIDYVGGAGALILGHSHPAIVAAVQRQGARGLHMFGTLNEPAIRLAERLVRDIPCAEKVVYATTGSEATAYAMRLARAFTGKDMILKFEGAYHGNHDYALTSTFPKTLGTEALGQDDTAGRPAPGRPCVWRPTTTCQRWSGSYANAGASSLPSSWSRCNALFPRSPSFSLGCAVCVMRPVCY
jgi:glutamate-1-semialdehyde 2,1-aminomutase